MSNERFGECGIMSSFGWTGFGNSHLMWEEVGRRVKQKYLQLLKIYQAKYIMQKKLEFWNEWNTTYLYAWNDSRIECWNLVCFKSSVQFICDWGRIDKSSSHHYPNSEVRTNIRKFILNFWKNFLNVWATIPKNIIIRETD